MPSSSGAVQSQHRRLCVFSLRSIRQDVSRCSGFEFEDVVAEIEGAAHIVAPTQVARDTNFRARRWLSKRTHLFRHAPSAASVQPLTDDYDLFGCFLQKPVELLYLDAVPNWRNRSKLAFCVIEELWDHTIDEFGPLLKSLDRFDLITCAFKGTCERLERLLGRPVIHLPGAADLIRFAPREISSPRPVDLYSIGRRRPELHNLLKQRMKAEDRFYLYDSATRPPIAGDHVVHRDLLASLVQRSQLFMVDIAKVGHSDQLKGEIMWGPRHVEGMAGGAVQIGYAPDSSDYMSAFDWPESVIRLPEESEAAAEVLFGFLDNPAELDRRRRINMAHVLDRHDWAHRWQLILAHFGLPASPALAERLSQLATTKAAFAKRSGAA